RAVVVSIGVKAPRTYLGQVWIRETNESEPPLTRRDPAICRRNQGRFYLLGRACQTPDYRAGGDRRIGGVKLIRALARNCGAAASRVQRATERDALLEPAAKTKGTLAPQAMLHAIKGIGPEFAAVLWSEGLYRSFSNRKQVAAYAGLAPTPWQSGSVDREQGVSKAGNPRLRTT